MISGVSANGAWRNLNPYSLEIRKGVPFILVPHETHPKLGNMPYLGCSLAGEDYGQFVITDLSGRLAFLRGGDEESIEVMPFEAGVYNEVSAELKVESWNKIAPGSILRYRNPIPEDQIKFGVDFDLRSSWLGEAYCLDLALKWEGKLLPFTLEQGARTIIGGNPMAVSEKDQLVLLRGRDIESSHFSISFTHAGDLVAERMAGSAALMINGLSVKDEPKSFSIDEGIDLCLGNESMKLIRMKRHVQDASSHPIRGSDLVWVEIIEQRGEYKAPRHHRYQFSPYGDEADQSVVIGRNLGPSKAKAGVCELSKNDCISRVHGLLTFDQKRGLRYEDLASLNGSMIDKKPVYASGLNWQDRLRLAKGVELCLHEGNMPKDLEAEGEVYEKTTSTIVAIHGFLDSLRKGEEREIHTYTGPIKKPD